MLRETPYPGGLEAAKLKAQADIDEKAGRVRLRYITDIPGQAMTYFAKSREVDRWDTPGIPKTEANFPLIFAAWRANGMATAQEARDLIAGRRDLWTVTGADIEERREGGKRSVEAATTIREVFVIRDATVTGLDGV